MSNPLVPSPLHWFATVHKESCSEEQIEFDTKIRLICQAFNASRTREAEQRGKVSKQPWAQSRWPPLKRSRQTGLWEAPEAGDWQGPESSGPSVGRGKRVQGTLSFVTNVGKIHTTEEKAVMRGTTWHVLEQCHPQSQLIPSSDLAFSSRRRD